MSALFFKVSWPQKIEQYRLLREQARKSDLTLRVKNASRTRGLPVFLFYLSTPDGDRVGCFSDLDEVNAALAASRGAGA